MEIDPSPRINKITQMWQCLCVIQEHIMPINELAWF